MTQSNAFDMTFAIPLPISQSAIATADRFAQRQPNLQKASQVRLNTLAVRVMQDYLQLMGIDTSLSGDSWNPVTQLMANVADLEIEGLGRLECRSVSSNAVTCPIPPEVWHERIGYVVLQINELQHEAYLLGFVETVEDEELPLNQLQPPEELFDHLDRLLHPVAMAKPIISEQMMGQMSDRLTSLSQWLQDRFQVGWETVESLLAPQNQLAYGFRGSAAVLEPNLVRRAKRIHAGIQAAAQPLLLVVNLMPQLEEINIRLQLYHEFKTYLPHGIKLVVLDNTNSVFLEAESRQTDNYIQLEFDAIAGEVFTVQVQFEGSIVTEAFVV
ncbi:DUF1822 family protein [Leptolyngbya sp. FACHB-541]|uniref:DUF1822 family protein n=1 Tax=Leptolyngbya sp. FACHB-541 TaxID=2692810 RepID=UPI001685AC41|nr:DUF1822 family protein [Leptolyngbya sp. FACHB-541]MBD1999326.1 DUF1822 family protein [Leptolyngbya sp. FACHB-541]